MERWYAVFTKPRKEMLAEENLKRQAFETCLPLIREERRRRNKWEKVIGPLFPRYLFVRFDPVVKNSAPIRSTQGVIKLVRFGDQLIPLPEGFIENLVNYIEDEQGIRESARPLFQPGDWVRILHGPFAEYQGIYQKQNAEERVLILMEFMGQTQRLWLPRDQVAPVS